MPAPEHTFRPAFDGSDFCTVPGCDVHRVDHEQFETTPDAPPAPVWMDADAAYGWAAGWAAGYEARRYESRG